VNARARAARPRQPRRERASALATYLHESRDIGLSLMMVLPLLLAYEIVMLCVTVPVRNGAEAATLNLLQQLPAASLVALRRGIVLLLMVVSLALLLRKRPKVARARWVLVEALLLSLALGPFVSALVGGVGLSASASATSGANAGQAPAWLPFLLSVGAGLWEELVFRLALLGGLAFVLARAFKVPQRAALASAIIVSSLAFALYHHVGESGEPLEAGRFAFRAIAGTILGVLFAFRGLAVVVYMHVFYDLICDLRTLHG